MDINTQNSSGMMNGIPPQVPNNKEEKKVGPIIGTLIILLILVIAALYFFGQKLNKQAPVNETPVTQTSVDNSQTAAASSSDNVNAINSDLDAQMKNVDYSF